MAAGQKRNVPLVPGAYQALEQFKQEVAAELGIQNYQGYLGDIPSRINGAVGGHMVRRMIAAAEQSLIDQATSAVRTGFQAGLSGSGGTVPSPSTVSEQGLQPPKVLDELKGYLAGASKPPLPMQRQPAFSVSTESSIVHLPNGHCFAPRLMIMLF